MTEKMYTESDVRKLMKCAWFTAQSYGEMFGNKGPRGVLASGEPLVKCNEYIDKQLNNIH